MKRIVHVILVVASLTGVPACNSSKYKDKRYERDQRIYKMSTDYAAYDKAGPERMNYVVGVDRKVRQRSQDSLDRTLKYIDETSQRDQTRWDSQQKNRQSWWKRIFGGKPEQMEDTFAKMTY